MIRGYIKIFIIVFGSILLISCGGGVKRVNGEMAFDAKSLINLAETFLKAGDYSNAMRLYKRAANENPKNIPSRLGLANTYKALGATDAALNFYDQVLQIDPGNKVARMGTGEMLITRNRPADALPILIKLSKEDPKNHRIYNLTGLAYDLLGEQEKAQMNYAKGLTLAPDNISLLNNLALSFAFEKLYAPAIRLLGKAINLDYSVTKARYNLMLVYILSGQEAAGRKIGAALMAKGEIASKINHYRWVKTLTPKQRAQAIFLGIKYFPGNADEGLGYVKKANAGKISRNIANKSKKRQLMEVLRGAVPATENVIKSGKPEQSEPENLGKSEQSPVKSEQSPVKSLPKSMAEAKSEPGRKSIRHPLQKVYRVQLGSYPDVKFARRGWQKIMRHSKSILAPYKPLIKRVTLTNGQSLFRLFVGNIEDKMIAQTVCNDLRGKKVDCLVLKTSR